MSTNPIESGLCDVCVHVYMYMCIYIYGRETFRHYFVVLLLSVSLYFILIQVYNLISSIIWITLIILIKCKNLNNWNN